MRVQADDSANGRAVEQEDDGRVAHEWWPSGSIRRFELLL